MPRKRAPKSLWMPRDFAIDSYKSVKSHVLSQGNPDLVEEFNAAWNALAYRYRSCHEHDRKFTNSVSSAGDAPRQPERYAQERELFGFFIAGYAAIESLCYGLFAIGSILKPEYFKMATECQRKGINPGNTAKQFCGQFHKHRISTVLKQLTRSSEFDEWDKTRNVLIHRTHPARAFYHVPDMAPPPTTARGLNTPMVIDPQTTASRRAWLAGRIHELLNAADEFTKKKEEELK
jgi:hypothetical protein